MIDIKNLRANPDAYKDSAKLRGVSVDIDKLRKLDAERTKLIGEVEGLRSKLNVKGKPSATELKELQKVKDELGKLEAGSQKLELEYQELILVVPNLVANNTPEGGEESSRKEKYWPEAKPKAISSIKDHVELAEANGWLDFERGAKVAGNKFYYLKGAAVRLQHSVMRMAMDLLEKEGFTLMYTPHMVNNRILEGTGFAPRGVEDQIYQIKNQDLALIGTAEIPLTGYHADEILEHGSLPLLYAALTPSYRLEAGAYGKHAKGLFRVHQFDKLEMYVYSEPAESEKWQQKLLELEEEICQLLEIPYRVVRIAAGDLGAPAYKKFDIEYWSPVDNSYRELASCSNCTDFQARRLNIKTRRDDGNTEFVHTLNGTAIAFSRVFIALVENHQDSGGKVRLPIALQQYYGREEL